MGTGECALHQEVIDNIREDIGDLKSADEALDGKIDLVDKRMTAFEKVLNNGIRKILLLITSLLGSALVSFICYLIIDHLAHKP